MPNFYEIFQIYLVPFAIAVPIVLLIFFVGFSRPDVPLNQRTAKPEGKSPQPPASSMTAVPKRALAEPVRILIVDDSAVPRAKLRKLFEKQGYEIETAEDGAQALDIIGKIWISVVVTDLEMPVMDGFELIAAIQGNMETEDIPVIAITGHEELSARVHDISGLYGIFKKPWNDRELIKRVETLCNLRKRNAIHA